MRDRRPRPHRGDFRLRALTSSMSPFRFEQPSRSNQEKPIRDYSPARNRIAKTFRTPFRTVKWLRGWSCTRFRRLVVISRTCTSRRFLSAGVCAGDCGARHRR